MTNQISFRWLLCDDIDDVLAVERASFDRFWTNDDFQAHLRQRHGIGVVAELHGQIVGYYLYELYSETLRLVRLAVAPDFRRQGIGHQMLNRLTDRLSPDRRREVDTDVCEHHLSAQLWLSACGWTATGVSDGEITFCWRMGGIRPVVRPSIPLALRDPRRRSQPAAIRSERSRGADDG